MKNTNNKPETNMQTTMTERVTMIVLSATVILAELIFWGGMATLVVVSLVTLAN